MNTALLRKGLDFDTNTISKSGRFYFECPACKSEHTASIFHEFLENGVFTNPIFGECSCGQKMKIDLIAFVRVKAEE